MRPVFLRFGAVEKTISARTAASLYEVGVTSIRSRLDGQLGEGAGFGDEYSVCVKARALDRYLSDSADRIAQF